MAEYEEVRNYQVDRKYRVTFEQASSTKGVLGFKVEVNSDSIVEAIKEAEVLLRWAQEKAPILSMEVK